MCPACNDGVAAGMLDVQCGHRVSMVRPGSAADGNAENDVQSQPARGQHA